MVSDQKSSTNGMQRLNWSSLLRHLLTREPDQVSQRDLAVIIAVYHSESQEEVPLVKDSAWRNLF